MRKNIGVDDKILNRNEKKAGRKAAQEVVLLCATANLTPQVKEKLDQVLSGTVDWEFLIKLADFQGIAPLVTHHLSSNGFSSHIPRFYFEYFQNAYKYTVYRNVILSNELVRVVAALKDGGVETICLKGTALAEVVYGNACLRPATDMDILIRPGDREKAGNIAAGLGYKPVAEHGDNSHPFHEEYYREAAFNLFLELHWSLENNQLVTFPNAQLWSRALSMDSTGIASRMLSPEDNLIFLANHLFKHHRQRIKFLCDIAELLKKYEGTLDWDYIVSSARSWEISPTLYLALKRAEELLGASVPADYLKSLKPEGWRSFLLGLLAGRESFIFQSKETKLNIEKANLAHSLMMKDLHKTKAVLKKYRGQEKKAKWLRTVFWIMVVFSAGLGHSLRRLVIKTI